MKHIYVVAFVLLAVWLILTGVVGLAGIAVSPVLGVIMNIIALVSGILFLIGVGKCCCCTCNKCNVEHRIDTEKKF